MSWLEAYDFDLVRLARDPNAPLEALAIAAQHLPEVVAHNASLSLSLVTRPLATRDWVREKSSDPWVAHASNGLARLAEEPSLPPAILRTLATSNIDEIELHSLANPELPTDLFARHTQRLARDAAFLKHFLRVVSVSTHYRDRMRSLLPDDVVLAWWQRLAGPEAEGSVWDLLAYGFGSHRAHLTIAEAFDPEAHSMKAFMRHHLVDLHEDALRVLHERFGDPYGLVSFDAYHAHPVLLLVTSPACPPEVLRSITSELLCFAEYETLRGVNEVNAFREELDERTRFSLEHLCGWLVEHPNIPFDALERLLPLHTTADAPRRPFCRDDLPVTSLTAYAERLITRRLRSGTPSPPAFLEFFREAAPWFVKLALAHPDAPDEWRSAAYENPRCTPGVHAVESGTYRESLILSMRAVPDAQAGRLVNDPDPRVRAALASRTRRPDLLERLARDADELVRKPAARNSVTPVGALAELADDDNEIVRIHVRINLRNRTRFDALPHPSDEPDA